MDYWLWFICRAAQARRPSFLGPAKFFGATRSSTDPQFATMAHLYLPPPPGTKVPPWRNSPAKAQLRDGILSGRYTEAMPVEMIYGSDVIFRQYKWENFKTNLTNLRAALALTSGRAVEDAANVAADTQRHAAEAVGAKIWAGSEAERLLKDDINNDRHVGLFPRDLRATRPEYQEWTLKEFREHVEQEKRSRKTQAYWLHRDKKKSKTEAWPYIHSK